MTPASDNTDNPNNFLDRRASPRHKAESTIYVELVEGNGGILLNISEGGMAVRAAMPLVDDQLPNMRFRFSSSTNWIEATGVVTWRSESKKLVGVRFIDLSEDMRAQITEWISFENSVNNVYEQSRAPFSSASTSDSAARNRFQSPSSASEIAAVLHGAEQMSAPAARIAEDSDESDIDDVMSELDELTTENLMPGSGARPAQSAQGNAAPGLRKLPGFGTRRAKVSRSMLKRYLVDERHRIRLYDLVSEQAEALCNELSSENFPADVPVTDYEFLKRVHRYEELTDELLSIIITGCFWGEKNQELIWAKLLERVANASSTHYGHHQWLSLQAYPALLLMYAGGVAAIANEKFATLEALLLKPRLIGVDGDCRLVDRLSAAAVIEDEKLTNLLVGGEAHPAPLSAYLCAFLRERFREFVPSDDVYDEVFDHFEYMFSLVWIDENPVGASLGWVPLGRFAWRHLSGLQSYGSIVGRISAEVSQQGKDWPALRAGLFGGSMQRFVSARNRVATFMGSQR